MNDNIELDMSKASDRIILLKVPKYIEEKWSKFPSNTEVGELRIRAMTGQKTQATLSLADVVVNMDPKGKIPKDHVLEMTEVGKQTLCVFSQSGASGDKRFTMEGNVVQKLDCRPSANASYMQMKRDSIRKTAGPSRQLQPLVKVVQNFKPIKDHAHNIEYQAKKKAEGKLIRDDKNVVMDMLFNAFEKHQYYNIKDLVNITKQPVGYLKEILKEVCEYTKKNPYRNMWELKTEYCHYKTAEKMKDEKIGSD